MDSNNKGGYSDTSDRGSFRIIQSEALISDGSEVVLIADYNGVEKIKYTWKINAATGRFIDQTMIKF